jgi:hypothetical protein
VTTDDQSHKYSIHSLANPAQPSDRTITMKTPVVTSLAIFSLTHCPGTESFTPIPASPLSQHPTNGKTVYSTSSVVVAPTTSTALRIGNLFGGMFGQKDTEDSGDNKNESTRGIGNGGTVVVPTTTVLDIPARAVKVGPLKFYLQMFFVGEQNKPVGGSWVLNQNNDGTTTLDMYYVDGTGMFSTDLREDGITVRRSGRKPSLQYLLQESVLLHSMLDELRQIAFEVEGVDQDKRLLRFSDPGALSKLRESLPARREEDEVQR